jgi:hypothetical protein
VSGYTASVLLRPFLLLAVVGLLLSGALPASAATTSVDRVAAAVLDDGVYVDPAFGVDVDEGALRAEVARATLPVHVVLLPETAAPASAVPDITRSVGLATGESRSSILVVTDRPFAFAASGDQAAARGVDGGRALIDALEVTTADELDGPVLTSLVSAFVDRVNAQAAGRGGRTSQPGAGGGGGGAGALLPLLLLGALGYGAYALTRSRRSSKEHDRSMQDARADVESLYARLGSDVQLLAPGDDDVARQALADAAERYNAAGALMARASTDGEWAAARRTAVEGLTAARVVRERLGLDPGPQIPMPAADESPRLEQAARVQVGDQHFDGSPRYTPGRPHYFEGGYYGGRAVPGGWYATPFWQTMLLTSVLGGRRRRGGYGYGGGFGGGYGGGVFGGFGTGAVRRPPARPTRPVQRRGGGGGWSGGAGGWGGSRGGGGWGGGARGGGGGRRGGGW